MVALCDLYIWAAKVTQQSVIDGWNKEKALILGDVWRLQDHLVLCQMSPKVAQVQHVHNYHVAFTEGEHVSAFLQSF